MSDLDDARLAAAVAQFRDVTMPLIRPAGSAAARAVAHRRKRNRNVAVCVAAVLALLPIARLPAWYADRTPTVHPTVSDSASPSASPSAAPSRSPVATAAPSLAPPSSPTSGPGSGGGPGCSKSANASAVDPGPPTIMEIDTLNGICPDAVAYFFWASYKIQDADTLVLVASGRGTVDPQHRRRTVNIPGVGDFCAGYFIVNGRGSVLSTVPWNGTGNGNGNGEPYGRGTLAYKFPYSFVECTS